MLNNNIIAQKRVNENKDNISLRFYTKSNEGDIEYEMSKELAKNILNGRKGTEVNMHPQEFLCKVVNEEFGIKGNCTRVITI